MGRADPAPQPAATIAVEVVWAPAPHGTTRIALSLPAGATLRDALAAAGLLDRVQGTGPALRVGVWGRVREDLGSPLREADRVELYRPLQVDPKEARRQRYKRAGRKGR